eukprot:PLAT3821.7.p1 GENE.PLAT3821.7~~PLAT3821.7.p1  ORF type:complete len:832 (+),score=473.90 PLAT3821.7:23-2497(+)
MGRKAVRVCVRTRPTADFAGDKLVVDSDARTIAVHRGGVEARGRRGRRMNNKKEDWSFRFHDVLHNAPQDAVYEQLASDVVREVMEGVNGTIMAYGQTGAGKTFTMIGDTRVYKHRGIAPRAIAQLFSEAENRPETEFTLSVSYMELYNERIFDLLSAERGVRHDYTVVESSAAVVKGMSRHVVTSEEEALRWLFMGESNRTTAEHALNKSSNRSHCIFTVFVEGRSKLASSEKVVMSKLHLVDLAGSERVKKTMESTAGKPLDSTLRRETMYINKSLTYLEQCVVALTSGRDRKHVPYRQTKLTHVLKDSLGGSSNTVMLACVWGEERHLEETTSTLKLAHRMMRVENDTVAHVTMDPALLVRKYERQIRELKQELLMHDALAERSGIVYDEFTPEQRADTAAMVRRYLEASPEEEEAVIEVQSLRQIKEAFKAFKVLFRDLSIRGGDASVVAVGGSSAASPAVGGGAAAAAAAASTDGRDSRASARSGKKRGAGGRSSRAGGRDEGKDESASGSGGGGPAPLVGELDGTTGGYALGTAPTDARPDGLLPGTPKRRRASGGTLLMDDAAAGSPMRPGSPSASLLRGSYMGGASGGGEDAVPSDRNAAYLMFKRGDGAALLADLQACKASCKADKVEVRRLQALLSSSKAAIDSVQAALAVKKADREVDGASSKLAEGEEEVVDEEEFRLFKQLADEKRQYRALHQDVQAAKSSLRAHTEESLICKSQLLAEFEEWFAAATLSDAGGRAGAESKAADDGKRGEDEDESYLDDGEKFERLEIARVVERDPESLAFFNAHKKTKSDLVRGGATRAMRTIKAKRLKK